MDSLSPGKIETMVIEDVEVIAQEFQETFSECMANVKKPNVLVTGVTGAGKSSLVNVVFGARVSAVGDGEPVSNHFRRFSPKDVPVVIYDSKGLEDGKHEEFIEDTRNFFAGTRAKADLGDHIHVIWYVINAAAARFEPFEVTLVEEVFAPTPVLFLLNKADIATAEQLTLLCEAIESRNFDNCKGIFSVVADRKNYSQSWCPKCLSDDVTYKRTTKQLFCEDCGEVTVLTQRLGLGAIIDETARLLPDLAKEAFLFAQETSMVQKDKRAREIVTEYSNKISMDVSGKALKMVGEMIGKVFILWGWNFLGSKVSDALVKDMSEEYKAQELSARIAMVAADTLFKRKLSRSVIACLGVMVNRPLRQLFFHILLVIEENDSVDLAEVAKVNFAFSHQETFPDEFMKKAFEVGIDNAIDFYWHEGDEAMLTGE